MAHFAELDENNKVIRVLVVSNEDCGGGEFPSSEQLGIDFLERLYGHRSWKQTSFNRNFRGEFAGCGYVYDETNNVFKEQIIEKTILEIAEEQVHNFSTGGTQN